MVERTSAILEEGAVVVQHETIVLPQNSILRVLIAAATFDVDRFVEEIAESGFAWHTLEQIRSAADPVSQQHSLKDPFGPCSHQFQG